MTQVREIIKGLWTFPIIMPNNPLKWLNCYVVKAGDGGRNLLIDTGFPEKACIEDLLDGIGQLGLDMKNTDVFLTHMHSDHTGNARLLESMGARIIISGADLEHWRFLDGAEPAEIYSCLLGEGAPRELAFHFGDRANKMSVSPLPENCVTVEEGDLLRHGDFSFRCIYTPGHTPGHMCLYDEEKKLILLGDHVLFDITPNLVSMPFFPNCLEIYMDMLRKIRELPVELALPAHRQQGTVSLAQRVDRLIAHHERRLAEMEQYLIDAEEGLSAYELASLLRWKIRAASWEDFPDAQKWFALGETMAHLVYLVDHDRVEREEKDGRALYFAK